MCHENKREYTPMTDGHHSRHSSATVTLHRRSPLPTFVGIGAHKGGSTSMYHYLKSHPEIFMAEPKELDFFVEELNWGLGRSWYEQRFAGADRFVAAGEISPHYTHYPHLKGVPRRLASLLPDVRL